MPLPHLKYRIHVLQWNVRPGQVSRNLAVAEELIRHSEPEKGDLILLPEMFTSGFHYRDLEGMAEESGRVLEWMSHLASTWSSALAGSIPVRREEGIVNSMIMIDGSGNPLGSYDKVHLFPLAGEDSAFSEGSRTILVNWNGIHVGLMICFDLRFPEMARKLCLDGAQLILVSAQWPAARISHFRDLVRVRAMENQLVMAASNSCGGDGSGLILGGKSLVAGAMGNIMGELGEDEGVLAVKVHHQEVERIREEFPVLSLRRPDVYK